MLQCEKDDTTEGGGRNDGLAKKHLLFVSCPAAVSCKICLLQHSWATPYRRFHIVPILFIFGKQDPNINLSKSCACVSSIASDFTNHNGRNFSYQQASYKGIKKATHVVSLSTKHRICMVFQAQINMFQRPIRLSFVSSNMRHIGE